MLGIVVLVVCGIVGLGLIGAIIWRYYRVELVDLYKAIHEERPVAAVFWLIVTLIYIGFLVIGGYNGSDVFLVVVGGIFALIGHLGKKSINFLFDSKEGTAHQIPIIAVEAVAVFSWFWPSLGFVAALTVVLVGAFFFTDASERWEEYGKSHWGRKVLYRGVQVGFALMLVWTVFKLSSPPLAEAATDCKRSAEQAVVAYFKNPTPIISRLYDDAKALFADAVSEAMDKEIAAEAKKPAKASASAPSSAPSSFPSGRPVAMRKMPSVPQLVPTAEEVVGTGKRDGETVKVILPKGYGELKELSVASGRLPYPGEVIPGKAGQTPPAPAAAPKTDDELLSAMRQRFGE